MTATSRLALLLFGLLSVQLVAGHSYLASPLSRSNQLQSNRGELVGPCDAPNPTANKATVARGSNFPVTWPRNNHPGGIIRLAWAPIVNGQSPSEAAFDQGAVKYVCHEQPCNQQNQCDANITPGCVPCATTVTVPAWLPDGPATFQWVWYGGGFGLSPYYSCVDFNIQGGVPVNPNSRGAIFVPGDQTSQQKNSCFFCAQCDTSFPKGVGPSLQQLMSITAGPGTVTTTPPPPTTTTPPPTTTTPPPTTTVPPVTPPPTTVDCILVKHNCQMTCNTNTRSVAFNQCFLTQGAYVMNCQCTDGAKYQNCQTGCQLVGGGGTTTTNPPPTTTTPPPTTTTPPPTTTTPPPTTTTPPTNTGGGGTGVCSGGFSGVKCFPGDCCTKFVQCANGQAFAPQDVAPGTVCKNGLITYASDCAGVQCRSTQQSVVGLGISLDDLNYIPAQVTNLLANPSLIALPTTSTTVQATIVGNAIPASGFAWNTLQAPDGATISATRSNSVQNGWTISGLTVTGSYILQLSVTDARGVSVTATTTIRVNAASNAPTVSASSSSSWVLLPTTSVSLSGAATGGNGAYTYRWTATQVPSGNPDPTFSAATSASTTASGLLYGQYIFQLAVTDASNMTSTDTVLVNVDEDHCKNDNGGCHVFANCTKVPWSRTCFCKPGYGGDGQYCELVGGTGAARKNDGQTNPTTAICQTNVQGIFCWPTDCCKQFVQCIGNTPTLPRDFPGGTLCYQGGFVYPNDPRCANVQCGVFQEPGANVPAPTCGNLVCEPSIQEDCRTCPGDCGKCPSGPKCGDGKCSGAETCATCAADCGACAPPPPPTTTTGGNGQGNGNGNGGTGNGQGNGNGNGIVHNTNYQLVGYFCPTCQSDTNPTQLVQTVPDAYTIVIWAFAIWGADGTLTLDLDAPAKGFTFSKTVVDQLKLRVRKY
jgi:hypothetical protein